MKSFGMTDKGAVRSNNQDCFIIEKCSSGQCLLAALCDGMGGANAGEVASSLSVKSFITELYAALTARSAKSFDYEKILSAACAEANTASYEYSRLDRAYRGMGTTLVGGLVKTDGSGHIVNVGDSRAYHISAASGSIYQISRDHSLVEELVQVGALTKEQAKTHPQKNVITRALGTEESVHADYFEFSLAKGDFLLLCSDGLSNTVDDFEMLDYAKEYGDPELLCRSLMSKALIREARDNVTVVAVMR